MENNLKASGCEYLSTELIHFSILVSGGGVFTLPAPLSMSLYTSWHCVSLDLSLHEISPQPIIKLGSACQAHLEHAGAECITYYLRRAGEMEILKYHILTGAMYNKYKV